MVNGLLLQKASNSEDYYGMGTTLLLSQTIFDNVLRVANVGDSRLYVIDDNDITQITRDHSLVEEMVLAGQLSKSEARTHCSTSSNKGNRSRGTSRTRDVFN